jgi:hypothetical protein
MNNDNNGFSILTGISLGVFALLVSMPMSRAFQPGMTLVEVEPSAVVFKVPMFSGNKPREVRFGPEELANAEGLNAKREVIQHRWVRVRPGIGILPGVRESRPEQKVFTASTADFRVTHEISAPTKEGSSFTFELSYNARIEGRGATPEEKERSERTNAARFIAATVGAIPRNQVHIEVDVAEMMGVRAANMFREILAPLAQQYEQLQIGANKGVLLEALEKAAAERIYDEFGVTISNLTYGGTTFPSTTQDKIDNNALAPVRRETSETRAGTEAALAKTSVLGQSAFSGSNRGKLFMRDGQLDALERWIEAMKAAVNEGKVSSPNEILPHGSQVFKAR